MCSIKNPIEGVEILDNVLSVSLDAEPEQMKLLFQHALLEIETDKSIQMT